MDTFRTETSAYQPGALLYWPKCALPPRGGYPRAGHLRKTRFVQLVTYLNTLEMGVQGYFLTGHIF